VAERARQFDREKRNSMMTYDTARSIYSFSARKFAGTRKGLRYAGFLVPELD
jgi:hypothetical protein